MNFKPRICSTARSTAATGAGTLPSGGTPDADARWVLGQSASRAAAAEPGPSGAGEGCWGETGTGAAGDGVVAEPPANVQLVTTSVETTRLPRNRRRTLTSAAAGRRS